MVKEGLQNREELVGDWGKLNLKKRCEMLHLKSGVRVSLRPGRGPDGAMEVSAVGSA